MTKNYYEALGVGRDASPEQIKKSYRKLARKYHPDVSKEADAEEQMQSINVAYDTLSNAEKKKNMTFLLITRMRKPTMADNLALVAFLAQVNNTVTRKGVATLVVLKTYLDALVQVLAVVVPKTFHTADPVNTPMLVKTNMCA